MDLLYALLVLLAVTRIFGELSVRMGQPALVGELVGGILVGLVVNALPKWFPTLSHLTADAEFHAITELGVFFLMLLAGMELSPKELTKGSGTSLAVATGGLLVPLGLGMALAYLYLPAAPERLAQALFLGTAVAITAVPVAIKVLIDLGQLESRLGQTIVAAALVDDVFSLILLSVLTALVRTGAPPDALGLIMLIGKVIAFFALTTLVGLYLLPKVGGWTVHTISSEVEFSLLVLVALGFAVLAEMLQMHFIIGAFIAGLFFSARTLPRDRFEEVQAKISGLTKGLLAPVFFASIGLHLDLSALVEVPGFVLALIAVALLGKLIGAGGTAAIAGMQRRTALALGIAMSARGAVELIIADIAMRAGLFSNAAEHTPVLDHMFSAVVIMAIVTTLLTPIGLRPLVKAPAS